MRTYLFLPVFFFSIALLGACMVTPLAPGETPAALETPDAVITNTVAATTITATASVTSAATLTDSAEVTSTMVLTATPAPTDTLVVTATPVLTPTAVMTTAVMTTTEVQTGTIAALVAGRPEFSTLNAAIAAVNLADELAADTTFYTVFAPTDNAFAALPAGALDTLLANPPLLTSVIQNHLLIEDLDAAGLVRLGTVLSAFGETLPITLTADSVVQVANATVIEADIMATNGVIHAIDTVLLPPDLVITPTVAAAAVTPVAPVTTTQLVTTTDQIITMDTSAMTIGDVISATAELATLETALGAAGLLPALEVGGELTIFAPTNAAFEAIPAAELQTLLNNTGTLAGVLQYHLVADNVSAADLVRLGSALSTSSQPLTITTGADGTVLVNNTQIVQADIVTVNGVIHLIDAVLMPPAQ